VHGVHNAIEFIETVTPRQWQDVKVGNRVAIIGGGNTAIDAATEAKRLGAEHVAMIYRRSRKEMSAYPFEQELATTDGVQFYFLTQPKRILGKKHVEAVECVKMKLGRPDADGRRVARPIPRSEFRIPVDMVITALGQNVEETFLAAIPNLKTDRGTIWVHPGTFQTSNPKYFAGGDCINGGKEVVNAAYDGKHAAHGIHRYLNPQ
jgi:glutamate synthase (NADPH/NADH) small chain